jgi:UDP-2-acetamido-2,6-beta-L-arabino-hexul-4-ose reductase
MKMVLVTGAQGFVGRNLMQALRLRRDLRVTEFDLGTPKQQLWESLGQVDVVLHLAGVNRPPKPEDYESGNAGFTEEICDWLTAAGRSPKIVFASSTQAELDNPYGRSKLHAEERLRKYAEATGAKVTIFRWTNLFGKWCHPNYNSVTATFCHNIARGLPIQISDPNREIELAYIDDVVAALLDELDCSSDVRVALRRVEPSYRTTLGDLAAKLLAFHDSRKTLLLLDVSDGFTRRLQATYFSYLPENDFAYQLDIKADDRGGLAEFLKSPQFGQIFVSRTKPGITRGNHYHQTKFEKFFVVEGEGIIRFRHVESSEVLSYPVSGKEFCVVDIPPGYTHSIENVGSGEMVVLFWSSEVFDPSSADTVFAKVLE